MQNREALKQLSVTWVDSQVAQKLGSEVFNGMETSKEQLEELKKIAEDLIASISAWKGHIKV